MRAMHMRWARAARQGGRLRVRKKDESGAVLIVATAGIVLAVVSAALAVDTGRLAQEKRRDQKVADLAALDAVRDLANHQTRAEASALRNAFPTDAEFSVESELGALDENNEFQPGAGPLDAVRVTVTSPQDAVFLPNRRTVRARAVARAEEVAGFSIGSSLASVDTSETAILNRVLSAMFGTSNGVNLGLVGYQGLVTADVTLGRLATQLGFGTVDELLTADLTLGQLLAATSTALSNEGDVAAATVNTLALAVQNTTTFKLGDFITVAQGSEGKAADTNINIFQLINSSAQMANKNNFIDAGTTLTLPVTGVGTLSTKLGIKVIEAARIYIGPEGGSATTSQVELTLTPRFESIDLIGGVTPLKLAGNLPVKFVGAGATGTMNSIVCSGPGQGIVVGVANQAVSTSVTTTLQVTTLLNIPVADVTVGPSSASTTPTPSTLSFAYPTEFSPPAPVKSTPSVASNLDVVPGQVSVRLLGALPLGVTVSDIIAATIAKVNPTTDAVATQLLTPAFRRLGFKLGSADVAALMDAFDPTKCGLPALVR